MQNKEQQKLIEKRDELRQRLIAIEKDYQRGLDPDPEEQAIELENAEVLNAIAKSVAEELRLIEQQLDEIS